MSISELVISIANKIKGIKDNVLAAYDAIASKGGEVPEEKTIANLPAAIASTQGGCNLEELTITQNGEYLPSEGVDGFSKVTARVVPTKRVMLPSGVLVENTQIIDGYWAGELVDTSTMVNMDRMFYICSQLQNLDVSNWDVSNVITMRNVFYGCSQLQNLDVRNWDVSGVMYTTDMFNSCSQLQSLDVSNWNTNKMKDVRGMFRSCSQLKSLDVSKWDTSSVTSFNSMFHTCHQLKQLDTSNWDTSSATGMQYIFAMCYQLQKIDVSNWDASNMIDLALPFSSCNNLYSIIGDKTIDDVIVNNIVALKGLKYSIELVSTILDRASLRAVINGLADLTGQTTQTLTLGTTLIAKLTEEDIAIATAKNWTIV